MTPLYIKINKMWLLFYYCVVYNTDDSLFFYFCQVIYNAFMDMVNSNKNFIRSLVVLNGYTYSKLADKMSEILGKKYTRDTLNGKLRRDTLTLKECQVIAEILGYKIEFTRK